MKTLSLIAVRLPCCLALLACSGLFVASVVAQPPEGDGPERRGEPDRPPRERGPGPEAFLRMLPLMKALDADGSGDISEEEIQNATAALKTLDKNKDGKLTEDELRPEFGRFGEGGPRGPGFGGPGFGRPGFGPPGFGSPDRREGDRPRASSRRDEARRDDRPREDREARRDDSRADGAPERDRESGERSRGEGRERGRGEPGRGGAREEGGPERGDRGRAVTAMVDRMLEFDADKDGQLSREELTRMIEQDRRGMGFGPGGGRPGADRGPDEAGDRPDSDRRPRRPTEE